MKFSVVTWNINSVRLRTAAIERLIERHQPDVLCFQEIKCADEQFPEQFFRENGYPHQAVKGQKSYHGVATVSKIPFVEHHSRQFCDKQDARHVATTFDIPASSLIVHNFYVPAGGDDPNPEVNEKFAHKLKFLSEMTEWFKSQSHAANNRMILLGDLNIAPHENDVWSHKQLLKVVSHTPIEVEHLEEVRASHDWRDAIRDHIPHDQKLFTWWSYRAKDWRTADKGRRLDHIWHTPALAGTCQSIEVIKDARGWELPSDHAPILAQFAF